MLKTFKGLCWIVLPLGLAVGCAQNRPEAMASYGPGPGQMLEPTSAGPQQRIYSEPGEPEAATSIDVNQAPSGASQSKWAIAEKIQNKLVSDRDVAPLGSSLKAEVGDGGIVTLHGTVSSPSEEKRVSKLIAQIPGVSHVDNQLTVGRVYGDSELDMRQSD